MPFSPAEIQDLPVVISAPRFATYLQAMGNDREKALALYEWNLNVSSALIIPLQVCEVAVRNGIAEAIEHVHGANWPWNNGFIRSLPRPKGRARYNPAIDLQARAAILPTTGKIIAELKFAFWENIFTAGQDSRIWNTHLRNCFPGAPSGQTIPQLRAAAYADLQIIRRLRNRIAHHEPIFTRNIADDYQRIHDMIAWRSQVAAAWMDRKQTVLTLLAMKP
ncbi:hypothetical protein K6W36_15870 [Acetobacter senegalensis]|uniref:hypothetical protein n=1 Tax=Acetobacter senegalensis TaxID=446692 RepID=UPI0007C7ED09|nr:hypothetical protein [Acetobacter senegalensis]MCG4262035.1 hypothetical protein [Acetobacter senegalensis]OAG71647.1 Abi-like protein [Gluconobacter japonicus]